MDLTHRARDTLFQHQGFSPGKSTGQWDLREFKPSACQSFQDSNTLLYRHYLPTESHFLPLVISSVWELMSIRWIG